jgi:uncharacterized protein DUF3833
VKLAIASGVLLLSMPAALASPDPRLDLTAFFTGHTHAENVMKIAFHRATPLIVESVGGRGDKGDFVLIDTVHEGSKPVRTRKWIMRQVATGHYTGSLSDATGPVDIVVTGNTAVVQYVMKGGLRVRQEMDLLGDGKTLANHVIVKKFGLRFATVEGKIRKLD